MLYESEVEKIALSRELKNLEDYIALLKLRTSGKDYLKYTLSGTATNYKIAPMLFLPLVENAYKHSSVKEGENIIKIDIRIMDRKLYFFVQNECTDANKNLQKEGGLGLNIVQRRLELIYPEMHSFEIKKEENLFKVELIIQLDEY
jgi:LytS/YehU family sensor histidine kinase